MATLFHAAFLAVEGTGEIGLDLIAGNLLDVYFVGLLVEQQLQRMIRIGNPTARDI
jgi:hypothetical protein